ncbi:hypothetical protein PQJ75_08625 [Rhodoplanes sp. TEM]|uniref:Uncharacterized protein n=1 Tax=Rhodoplanes tepidamans TaxID=200616 RepID=A0ABT5J8T2_RHOTP|nr:MULTISPECIES: hypothetical protein [Rhodoplanes]MDC7786069.1 hypothetical protein [Rhodoplanes tepidamans]MDC7983790.1 hypothetical protein [Rhodoplanes sp. TEM]MDQ0354912.1 hypothetical protein [Rhodoplanes tepidamans]
MPHAPDQTTPTRRFTMLYKTAAALTQEREIVGTLEEALAAACAMLRDGRARHVNLIEVGRIDGVVPHSRIVRWCAGRETAP